jgi:hypothetical protein
MVEQWSPKPKVKGSNPFSPVNYPCICKHWGWNFATILLQYYYEK